MSDHTLEANVTGLVANEVQSAPAGQGSAATSEEPPVTAPPSPAEPPEKGEKRPISEKKLAANRANAQRSTGPMTAEGKEKSKLNAVKHGLTSRYFPAVIEAGTAEWEQLETVRTDFLNHYQPIGPMEELMLEKVTIEYMRYRRLVERELVLCVRNRGYYPEIVDKLTRYQTAINRQFYEAMQELERLQALRKAQEREKAKEEHNGESDRSTD
jgi:hypothetical protein